MISSAFTYPLIEESAGRFAWSRILFRSATSPTQRPPHSAQRCNAPFSRAISEISTLHRGQSMTIRSSSGPWGDSFK